MIDPLYALALIILPILFSIVGFFTIRTLNDIATRLGRLDDSVKELGETVSSMMAKHEGLDERVDRLEDKVFR